MNSHLTLKSRILAILLGCAMFTACDREKTSTCYALGAEDCKVTVKDHVGTFEGKDCGGTLTINGQTNQEVAEKIEKMGFECEENK